MRKVLVLNTDSDLRAKGEKFAHDEIEFGRVEDFQIILENDKDMRVLYKGSEDIPYDLIYFRVWKHKIETTVPVHKALHLNNYPVFVDELTRHTYKNKLVEMIALHNAGLPIPKTVYIRKTRIRKNINILTENISFPCIMKDMSGKQGEYNFVVQSEEDISRIIDENPDIEFIFQEFIENTFDYRVLVLDFKATYAYKRMRTENADTHLNNVSAGGSVEHVDLTKDQELCTMAEKAARTLNRNICGVDVIQSPKGERYLLEGNACPGLKSLDVGEVFVKFLLDKRTSSKQ